MHNAEITILGIESSCDDTSAAVMCNGKILANVTAGQDVHRLYGGVVPELASRAHQKHIVPVVDAALKQANIAVSDLDAIAYTLGPGLLGSLLVGSSFAKSMAQALHIPAYPIHHMRAHVLAHFIDGEGMAAPQFPFLCLTVSGGHTQIVKVTSPEMLEVIGETLDDAAGEAFDKAAKLLGLPYPGGPLIDKHAMEGNPSAFKFTQPKVDGLNWSFSGLKTGFRNLVEKQERNAPGFVASHLNDLCASLQYTIVEMLMSQLKAAVALTGITEVALAGGVSANTGLRKALVETAAAENWRTYTLPLEYCTDNGAMIAAAGLFAMKANAKASLGDTARARWKM
jgi:N6-L-threonylcarbamoyladenine synthase